MPADFYRTNASFGSNELAIKRDPLFAQHPIQPGYNRGVGNYVVDPNSANFSQPCKEYTDFVNITVQSLYPNPKGVLLRALKRNLDYFYSTFQGPTCPQVFPYGR
jgi:unspecific peroxygenase